ncbi:hypothetical protein DHEL01_v207577 [Diaporthe helianthi]|uniref:Uncharacterized protein n=1 Tax=Diaporthe helianthi TaxID=158607 RepID=A0A2P5HUX3_DIAHE|nr:hypothetical protein DHEL01_v207577 [Diaporthe helianthi]
MGVLESKVRYGHQSTSQESEAPLSKDTKSAVFSQEIVDWERVYKERFARTFIFSKDSWKPPFMPRHKPLAAPWEWRLNTDGIANRFNPRYMDATPEPLSKELAERTIHELRKRYHDALVHSYIRAPLKLRWSSELAYVPHVPYLTDEVIFPHASEIKNGDILPSRVRAYISGEPEDTPLDRDAFSTQRLRNFEVWPNINDFSQLPDDNMLISRCTWLNQTTAMYFEPKFREDEYDVFALPYFGRGLLAAWHDFNRDRGEHPNLQQTRYFAHPVMLLGEPRPIADVIATHRRICDALADAQEKPVSPKDPYSWVEHGAEMGVVYPSIIIVADQKLTFPKGRIKDEAYGREVMFEHLSVLLVRTGNEEHLSEPIDLSGLGDAILPLGRDELFLQDNQQVVRVRMDTAVRFIMSLERREQGRCPRLTAIKRILDEDTFRGADGFAAGSVAMAEKNGSIDRNHDTYEAVRLARAYLDGEPPYVDPHSVQSYKQREYARIRWW